MRLSGLRRSAGILCASVVALAPPLIAQTPADRARTYDEIQASFSAHKTEFDYLLGDWEFTGVRREPKGEQKFHGYWSALRLDGGQILDEYRVVGDKGETYYVTVTLRAYNGTRDQWDLVSSDMGGGLRDLGTGHRVGAEMRIDQTFGVGTPHPSVWRIRYHDIQPDRFSWSADRSLDDGKTWVTNFQEIEAHRIGPVRTMGPLTQMKGSTK